MVRQGLKMACWQGRRAERGLYTYETAAVGQRRRWGTEPNAIDCLNTPIRYRHYNRLLALSLTAEIASPRRKTSFVTIVAQSLHIETDSWK